MIKQQLQSWRYSSSLSQRDLRLDLLRGYFIVVMIIDHVGFFPAWTQIFTGGNRLWVSAAEGFIIVSGLVFGMLYRRLLREHGWHWCIRKVFRRSAQLYVVTVIGQIVFYTGDYLLRAVWGRPSNLSTSYFELIVSALFQVRNLAPAIELLTLYVLLLPMGLVALYLIERRYFRWLVLGSYFLWQARALDPGTFNFFRNGFNPATWQTLFVAGIVGGYYRNEIMIWWESQTIVKRRKLTAVIIGATAVILVISYWIAFKDMWADVLWLDSFGPIFSKNRLAPGRFFAAILVFGGLYQICTLLWKPLQRCVGWLLLPLGQHALVAYVLHSIPRYLAHRLPGYPDPFGNHDPMLIGVLHIFIVLLIWLVTRIIVNLQTTRPFSRHKERTAIRNQTTD